MKDALHNLNVPIPTVLYNRMVKVRKENGYTNSWMGRLGMHIFLNMTHEERVEAHKDYLKFVE